MKKISLLLLTCCINATVFAQGLPVTTGLNLHLDNANRNFTNATASVPATWRDISPANNHVAAPTLIASPTLDNNLNGVTFDPAFQHALEGAGVTNTFNNSTATIFVVRIGNVVGNTSDRDATPPVYAGALISIAQPTPGVPGRFLNNEFLILGNWAKRHTSVGNFAFATKDSCYGSLPADRPVIMNAVFNTGTGGNNTRLFINGNGDNNVFRTDGMQVNYTAVDRKIIIGARQHSTLNYIQGFNGTILEVVAYNRVLSNAEINQVNDYLKCKYMIDYRHGPSISDDSSCNRPLNCDTVLSCVDRCYWKLDGNNINGARNIFGTLNNNPIRIRTNNIDRGIMSRDGLLGWNTMVPSAYLHVDCNGHNNSSNLSDIRFENLESNSTGNLLVINNDGYVFNSGVPISSGGGNNCNIINMVPVNNATGLNCSQIFDDGTSVGINSTSGFGYTWSGGLTGGSLPPVSGTLRLKVSGVTSALAYIATSDISYKTNINTIENALDIISGLNGRTYNWTSGVIDTMNADTGKQYGFIAQEVKDVLPEAVTVDGNGNYGLQYNAIIPLLVEGQKALIAEIKDLRVKYEEISEELHLLKDCCEKKGIKTKTDGNPKNQNYIKQNIPNPFSGETVIEYYVYDTDANAYVGIYNLEGKEVLREKIKNGSGSISVNANSLVPGMYHYSLIVNGNIIDTKKMVYISN